MDDKQNQIRIKMLYQQKAMKQILEISHLQIKFMILIEREEYDTFQSDFVNYYV